MYAWLGVEPPRGVLLHGPPGCGKTALANAIANQCRVPFLRVSAPEIVSGMSGMLPCLNICALNFGLLCAPVAPVVRNINLCRVSRD